MPLNGVQIVDRLHDGTNPWAIFHNPHERPLCGAGQIVKRSTSCDVPIEVEDFCGVPAHG